MNLGTPGPTQLAGYTQTPDLFNNMSLWSMPWTPPAPFGQPLAGMPAAHPVPAPAPGPATPIQTFQGLSPLPLPATAPPPGMSSAELGFGGVHLGLGMSPAPGPAPATIGAPEGLALRGLLNARADPTDNSIVCDLGKRLASLDVVCNGLAEDVRGLAGPGAQGEDAGSRSERLVHRI